MRRWCEFVATLVCLNVLGCKAQPDAKPEAPPSAAAPAPARSVQKFGAAVPAAAPAESVKNVLQQPEQFAGKDVVVEGHVRRACTRKGCWMELSTGAEPQLPGCRVSFKDYGFFVPTDSAGSTARVEAKVELSQLDPRHVAHMESEGATFANKQADGSAREVRLVATGVELWRQ